MTELRADPSPPPIAGAYIHHALHSPTLSLLYRAQFNLFFWPLVFCWFAVLWTANKASPPQQPPQSVRNRTAVSSSRARSQSGASRLIRSGCGLQVYECDDKGEPVRCWEDECGGSWKGVRTRHCKVSRQVCHSGAGTAGRG